MVMCWVPGCCHYNNRETCKFFVFPKAERDKQKWLKLIRRAGVPGVGARVCSCHFRDGQKENGPEIFERNIGKLFGKHHLTPEKKKRHKKGLPKATLQQSRWKSLKALPKHRNRDKKSRKLDSSTSSTSEEIQDYSYIFTEHSYSLWRRSKIERKKNVQFEFVDCMTETEFLENAEDSSIQDIISKELLVKKEFENNTSIETTENKGDLSMSDIYLNQVKEETLADVELSPFKIKEEEIYIKNEIIEEEFEISQSTSFIKTESIY